MAAAARSLSRRAIPHQHSRARTRYGAAQRALPTLNNAGPGAQLGDRLDNERGQVRRKLRLRWSRGQLSRGDVFVKPVIKLKHPCSARQTQTFRVIARTDDRPSCGILEIII